MPPRDPRRPTVEAAPGSAEEQTAPQLMADPGLCAGCQYAQIVSSRRAAYLRCAYSDLAPDWPRYPPLPVTECPHRVEARVHSEDA